MEFKREFFDPDEEVTFRKKPAAPQRTGDRRDGQVYVPTDKIILTVNAALATGRPLLIEGPPGSGKSSLAPYIAKKLGWWYYERVVTSRTTAQDLLWEYDALRRLSDAQTRGRMRGREAYVEPGVLWWTFSPSSARRVVNVTRGVAARDPGRPGTEPEAVLLLDEIDKADPDVPNDLLVPLGSREFFVREANMGVKAERSFLLILTTNGERELPAAFIRRCVRLKLEQHTSDELVRIAQEHFDPKQENPKQESLYRALANWLVNEREAASQRREREPSTAEYLDAIRAILELRGTSGVPERFDGLEWKRFFEAVVLKVEPPGEEVDEEEVG